MSFTKPSNYVELLHCGNNFHDSGPTMNLTACRSLSQRKHAEGYEALLHGALMLAEHGQKNAAKDLADLLLTEYKKLGTVSDEDSVGMYHCLVCSVILTSFLARILALADSMSSEESVKYLLNSLKYVHFVHCIRFHGGLPVA